MKRIYNKVYQAAMAALMLTAATACTGDNALLQNNDTPQTGRPVTITATYQGAGTPDGTDAQTRTGYSLNGNGGMQVKWKKGDKIYIINADNLQMGNNLTEAGFEEFTLVGEGVQATGTFQNENSSLDLTKKMYAVYCGNNASNKISVTIPPGLDAKSYRYSFNMTGQRQPETNKTPHLVDYDLMCATVKDNATNPSFNFTHINAILRLKLKLPSGNTVYNVKEVKVANSQNTFISTIIVNPESEAVETGTFTDNCTLKCGENDNGMKVNGSPATINAYMMVQSNPISANSNITITVTCTDGNTYSTTITPTTDFVMSPGTYNSIEATLK